MPLPALLPKPYVHVAVEEVAQVRDLDSWGNTNVRVFGQVRLRLLEESLVAIRGLSEDAQEEGWVDYRSANLAGTNLSE